MSSKKRTLQQTDCATTPSAKKQKQSSRYNLIDELIDQFDEEKEKTKNKNLFPSRAFIQTFDHNCDPPPDYQLVIQELKKRHIPYTLYTTEEIEAFGSDLQLTQNDLVVGNFDWTRWAVQQLGLTMPPPPDYPNCLKDLLHRKLWQTTLGEAKKYLLENKNNKIFIKPTNEAKGFAAIVEPRDQMIDTLLNGIPGILIGHNPNTTVWCSEVVRMVVEWRVYVVYGEIRAICRYRGLECVPLDMKVVKKAINTLCNESDEGKTLTGCGIDFAIMEKEEHNYVTCLVEVNDGFSLGRYKGISGKDYTDLLIARWKQLVQHH